MAGAHRILIVDDNQVLRENLSEALLLEGYQVEAVGTGLQALQALASGPLPALLLVDMMMPGMSGGELVSRLRQEPRLSGLRVILVSGLPAARDGLAVDAVLGKPFGVAELLAVVERLLGSGAGAVAPA